MLKVVHTFNTDGSVGCGWSKDLDFLCPNCKKPFCEEDTQQSTGGLLVGYLSNEARIKKLEDDLAWVKNKLLSCKHCRWD